MRYVILRDDDTNALTPPECLDRLYRPFLERGLPINLSVIPEVRTEVRMPDGRLEGFLMARTGSEPATLPMAESPGLLAYLGANAGYHVLQHGCYHDYFEFERTDRRELARRVEHGARRLQEAGLGRPRTFVAPYDRLSRDSMAVVADKFDVVSTGWFELGRMPCAWWPQYAMRKLRQQPHWQVGESHLLSHPGCLLSYQRPVETMLESIRRTTRKQMVTVLVTHWWEYFINDTPDEAFIKVLHQTAEYLAGESDIRVVSFDDVADGRVPLS
ncbi:MAG: hypothetical protein K0R17_3290 [Rariglobus sp.]|nr:hypothetical protein [Rariglobus sp.]